MSYQKHNFISKQKLTAEAMNQIEEGIVQNESAINDLIDSIPTIVSDRLADKTQVTLEFVDSLDNCVDPAKLYVLSDGYIYSYSEVESKPSYTNVLSTAVAHGGSDIYNDIGYKNDTRWSASSSTEKEASGITCTGFFKIKKR